MEAVARPEPIKEPARGPARGPAGQWARFETRSDADVDVAVVVVTFASEDDVDPLVHDLRRQACDLSLRVVFVDNDSEDASHERAARHTDVVAVAAGANLGYGAAINLGCRHVGSCAAVLVLNPDVRLEEGAVARLLERQRSKGAGAVVPAIRDPDGRTYPSIRFEPTVVRAVGDALLGSRLPQRPRWTRETEYASTSYAVAHAVEWATGAAVLLSHAAVERVGLWDESFFLYSEETDYLRRLRDAGLEVWFEPAAVVMHRVGGSGTSPELSALLNLNRVRYFRRYHGGVPTFGFRAACVLAALLRMWQPGARRSIVALLGGDRYARVGRPDVR